jgi:hypothetical protein
MADSRLTDLPKLTKPSDDDVLYIVDVSRDSSNKITYANLVTDTIDSLSAYLDSIDIPRINSLFTDVAVLSVTQLAKASQESLNTTDSNLNVLTSNVAVYAGQITKNVSDIVALSGYIDDNASQSDLNATNTRVNEVSASVLSKASQEDLNQKASLSGFNLLQTDVNIISGDVATNSVVIANNTTRLLSAENDILVNTQRVFTLDSATPSLTSFMTLQNSVSTMDGRLEFAMDAFRYLSSIRLEESPGVPFEIASLGHKIKRYNIPSFVYGPLSADGFSTCDANISGGLLENNTWKGLHARAYTVDKNVVEVSIFNPTSETVKITGADLCLRADGRRITWLTPILSDWYGDIPTSPASAAP